MKTNINNVKQLEINEGSRINFNFILDLDHVEKNLNYLTAQT